ncbi:MAG: TonB-dependent receptor, partial [Flavobacteriales bacterium]|nr:TonB-dependent receptor [Flavobacteriales bacterium]
NTETINVHPRYKDLFNYFKKNKRIVDIKDYDKNLLGIYSRDVFRMIKKKEEGWEDLLPDGVAETIKKRRLFGYIEKN